MSLGKYVAVLLVLMMIAGGITYYIVSEKVEATEDVTAYYGDHVQFWYYGYVLYGDNMKVVFDTNIESVAKDNLTYPKALSFKWPSRFEAFNTTVGNFDIVEGLDYGIVGMHVNETKLIKVPYNLGYGPENPNLIETLPVEQWVPIEGTMNISAFGHLYKMDPQIDGTYFNKDYGWYFRIVNITNDIITYINIVENGKTYYPYEGFKDWSVEVDETKDGQVHIIRHAKEYTALPDGGIVTVMDNGMIKVNKNNELRGKTLYFVVTLDNIIKREKPE